jgi:hypothetical protein
LRRFSPINPSFQFLDPLRVKGMISTFILPTMPHEMPRRTIHIPESTEKRVRALADEGESFSAAVTRLLEAGAAAVEGKGVPRYVGTGDREDGPTDLGRRAEHYLQELATSD